jgi:hypothetical protein
MYEGMVRGVREVIRLALEDRADLRFDRCCCCCCCCCEVGGACSTCCEVVNTCIPKTQRRKDSLEDLVVDGGKET